MSASGRGENLEEGLIAAMVSRAPHFPSPRGPGDDAAVLGERVITVDALVEGVHFLREHPPAWLGEKMAAVSFSDVAAMGARPEGLVVSAALPKGLDRAWWEALSEGLGAYLREAGLDVTLAGGDVVGSPGPIMLSVTAWGALPFGAALCRDGGEVGSVLMVNGPIGRAGVGLGRWLAAVEAGAPESVLADPAVQAHLRPRPPLAVGPWALVQGAQAGMDLSDGLATDLPRLARASGLAIRVDLEHLPADPACGAASIEQRVSGGEDYSLMVLAPAGRVPAFQREGFVAIGEATRDDPSGLVTFCLEGRVQTLDLRPFDHFAPTEP